ncbi:/ pta / Phosphate acetyltransferase /:396194 Reverse [Candidatus Hepatoplasma crinochetorum]|uniref:/ pta / Phosphate acetyltransferase /:396194 Reverse n=1 Tax=Candidatus Hepatoplasma crinochetorum TaxID=295596 RepID=A0A0G7ZL44_9MOLU|nr:/ pta / Phosphate acetyltransferase /:396194 Reverse [Candidatus Hepatoplasma crinochetorum]
MIQERINFSYLKERIKKYKKEIIILSTDNDKRFFAAKKIIENTFPNLKYLKIDDIFIKNYNLEQKKELLNLYKDLRKNKEDPKVLEKNFNNPNYFANLLLKIDKADGICSGVTHPTADILRPSFQILKTKDKNIPVSSFMWLSRINTKDLFFADISVNLNPSKEELANIAMQTADSILKLFQIEPIIAMLSFSTLGSGGNDPLILKIREATEIVKRNSKYKVIGEIQWDAAWDQEIFKLKVKNQHFLKLPNVFIFPDLNNGNIGYKIASTLGNFKAVGPILQNITKPVNDLSRGAKVEEIVDLVIITALQVINNN